METSARGYPPALNRSYNCAVTIDIASIGRCGPLLKSALAVMEYVPSAFFKEYPFSVMVKETICRLEERNTLLNLSQSST